MVSAGEPGLHLQRLCQVCRHAARKNLDLGIFGGLAVHFCDLLMHRRAAVVAAVDDAGEFSQHVDLGPAERRGELASERRIASIRNQCLPGSHFNMCRELAVGDDVAAAHHMAIGFVGISQPLGQAI